MSPNSTFHPEDLPLYAMQLLPADEAAQIRLHVDRDPNSAQEIAEIQGILAAIAFTADMHAPAASARSRLLKAVAQEKRTAPPRPVVAVQAAPESANVPASAVDPSTGDSSGGDSSNLGAFHRIAPAPVVDFGQAAVGRRSLPARVLPWLGWAIAAGLALTTGNLYQKSEGLKRTAATQQAQLDRTAADAATARDVMDAMTDQTAMRVTLTRQGALLSPTGRTVYSAEKGVLIFSATNLEPIQTFKVYELWLIPSNGGKPIPAGTFRPDAKGAANMVLTTMPKGVDAKAFGITIEEDGGSKIPTPPILMTGA